MAEPVKPAYLLYRWFWSGLDLIYPPDCGSCGRDGARWCADCQRGVNMITPPICDRCGQNIQSEGVCHRCRDRPPHFTALRSYAIFGGSLRAVLHRLKYRRDISLGEILARPMIQMLKGLAWDVQMVVPVPLGVARLRERGYNQAALIARPIALGTGIAYRPHVLRRVRETQSQVDLSLSERRDNVRGAFQGDPKAVTGRRILIVDDVATSSATLDACAAALLEAGAKQAFGLTVARAE